MPNFQRFSPLLPAPKKSHCMGRLHFPYHVSWDHLKAFHKPPVLLSCYCLDLAYVPRPSESAIGKSFVKQQESVTFIEQTFYAVRSSAAEKEEGPFLKRIHPEFLLDQTGKAIDPASQICIAASYIYMLETCGVIEHSSAPPGPLPVCSGSMRLLLGSSRHSSQWSRLMRCVQ